MLCEQENKLWKEDIKSIEQYIASNCRTFLEIRIW